MSHTAHVNATAGTERGTLNVTSHDAFSQTIVQVINQVDQEGIPPSAARDVRVAELIARAVQAQVSQDFNARGDSARGDSARGDSARGDSARGSRAHASRVRGQGRGNGRGGRSDLTRRAERTRRGGGSYYPAHEAERTRRRGGSYYPAREAERTRRRGGSYYRAREAGRIARDRRGGRGAVNGVPRQAPHAHAANYGPQWWTQAQAGQDEMTGKNDLLLSLPASFNLQCIIGPLDSISW
ncbi:unnamed protein product [Penicillium nalgiovense]|uniref:Uncharacterized protein n=1 Tax=Penicillium nalgiovense TaxID=60175 RepID=A0A9W4MP04_PENNA|nr:unnamed protein product [Penicillium nalgiovense]CAG7937594.1 unnamed protein product [Penicillium nalgiovense]CAG7939151.1 unnamed protein product [Penicillium nalgiovense]CAG7939796.1 unnamed protein product [Penicillium nalgiovense]CAG7942001.1 unnamed protein product [Penicillium nalgiovense]